MGCCVSKPDGDKAKDSRNDEIDRALRTEQKKMRNDVKLLLLGAGESGKSTLFRQVHLINDGQFTSQELDGYREVITRNCIDSMRSILDAMAKLGIALENADNQVHASAIADLPPGVGDDGFPPAIADAIEALWQDDGVRACLRRSREYQLHDSASYFFTAVRRISAPDFVPTNEDVLRCRVKTTGISEMSYKMDGRQYRLVDVGGQRSERKKWIHCFEDVTAIIFMVAVNEYDMTLIEDQQVNRMREALYLFDSICNSKWFSNTAVILLMNKIDLLSDKILVSPLEAYFSEYNGGPNYQRALEFITNMFVSLHKSNTREIYIHSVCATVTEQVSILMKDFNQIITNRNLRVTGFM